MVKKSISIKLISMVLLVAFAFTLLPSTVIFANNTTDYEFVITANKDSLAEGEEVKFTVTVNGSMKDLSMLQYRIQYDPDKFNVAVNAMDPFAAMDPDWYNVWAKEIYKIGFSPVYDGLFEIDFPTTGPKTDEDDADKSVYSVLYVNQNGRKITTKSCIYNQTSVVAGVIKFTAKQAIASVADEIVLKGVEVQTTRDALNAQDKPSPVDKTTSVVQLKKAGPSQEAIDAMAEIAKIGTVTYTEASKALIDAANAKYQLVSDKTEVENEKVLTDAIDTYNALKLEKVNAAKAEIDAIGTVTYTEASKALINAAQAKYDAVLNADKEEVTNAKVLTDALSRYDELKNLAINAAKSAIDAIGEVKYTAASKNLIDTAEAKYGAVLAEDKNAVTNAGVLAAAKTSYAQIETQITTQVKAVEDAIDDLPEEITLADETAVNAAKANYLAISEEYRHLVTNYAKVEAALEVIASLKQQIEDVKADIDRLPAEITLDDKDAVEEIYDSYNGLTAEQQALVTNIDKLNSAKTKIEKIENDIVIAEAFDADAEALGDVTLDDEDAVKDLRDKYTALTNDQKAYVKTLEILEAAEEKIVDLKAAKAFDDAVDVIYADGITIEDDAAIIAVRKAYADLSETQQGYVTKLAELEEAETKIEELKAAADKEELDKAAALGVDNMIANLPEVITIDSEKAVKAARDAYEVLTDDQKEYVENLEILEEAEAKIQTIREDMAAAKAVDDAIAALGEITIEDEEAIKAAREAYDALTEEQLDYVKNLEVLVAAEAAILVIKEDMAAAYAVESLIDVIGDVEYTEECKEKLAMAREAYNNLTDVQKAYVGNLAVLETAEEAYKNLVPDASQTEEAIGGYGDVYVTVFTDIEEGKKVVLGGNTAMMIKLGEDTYYVVITDEKVDADTVVVTNEPTEPAKLGDIDASGRPTEADALAANKKAAQKDVALFANAYAYVLADVDGDGKITALDALMISKLAIGEIDDTYLGLVTGK